MGKPTMEELEHALRTAAAMRESGEDPHFIAKSLLNLNYRLGFLEKVLLAAEMYIHSGQNTVEHARLVTAIDKAREADRHSSGKDAASPWGE